MIRVGDKMLTEKGQFALFMGAIPIYRRVPFKAYLTFSPPNFKYRLDEEDFCKEKKISSFFVL